MKGLRRPLLLLAALLIAFFLIVFHAPLRAPLSVLSPQSAVEIRTARIQESTTTYSIDAQYPQFTISGGTVPQQGIDAVNASIKAQVQKAVDDIKNYPANPPDMAMPQNALTVTFDRVYVGPDYLSVELLITEYTGGAHPNTLYDGLAYDRATGRELSLDDALSITGLSIGQLSAQASSTLAQHMGSDYIFPDGTAPDPANFSSFVISSSSVTFIFQPYEVGPYSAGPQEVSVPRR